LVFAEEVNGECRKFFINYLFFYAIGRQPMQSIG
jgi:hypothetical protein